MMTFIYPASIIISVFFAFLFMLKDKRRLFDITISLFFVFRSFELLYGWIVFQGKLPEYTYMLWLAYGTTIVMGVFLYLSVRFLLNNTQRFDFSKNSIHIVPVVFKYSIVIIFWILFRNENENSIISLTFNNWY